MNYEEFKEYVTKAIKEHYEDAEIILNVVHKNQQKLDGLSVRRINEAVSPTIYLNGFYEEYKRDEITLLEIINKIILLNDENDTPNVDYKSITSLEASKERIYPRVVGIEGNDEYLSDKPHMKFADSLAIIYYVDLSNDSSYNMSTIVSDSLLKGYGISLNKLHEIAISNLKNETPVLRDMNDVITEIMAERIMTMSNCSKEEATMQAKSMNCFASDGLMYVLSNKRNMYGASVILNEEFMQTVSEKLGGNYFILPSSVHECILVPTSHKEHSTEDFEEMIRSVNSSEVAPQDKLSDHLFYFDSKDKSVKCCYKDDDICTNKSVCAS